MTRLLLCAAAITAAFTIPSVAQEAYPWTGQYGAPVTQQSNPDDSAAHENVRNRKLIDWFSTNSTKRMEENPAKEATSPTLLHSMKQHR